jgi:hypothetical protein
MCGRALTVALVAIFCFGGPSVAATQATTKKKATTKKNAATKSKARASKQKAAAPSVTTTQPSLKPSSSTVITSTPSTLPGIPTSVGAESVTTTVPSGPPEVSSEAQRAMDILGISLGDLTAAGVVPKKVIGISAPNIVQIRVDSALNLSCYAADPSASTQVGQPVRDGIAVPGGYLIPTGNNTLSGFLTSAPPWKFCSFALDTSPSPPVVTDGVRALIEKLIT